MIRKSPAGKIEDDEETPPNGGSIEVEDAGVRRNHADVPVRSPRRPPGVQAAPLSLSLVGAEKGLDTLPSLPAVAHEAQKARRAQGVRSMVRGKEADTRRRNAESRAVTLPSPAVANVEAEDATADTLVQNSRQPSGLSPSPLHGQPQLVVRSLTGPSNLVQGPQALCGVHTSPMATASTAMSVTSRITLT